MKAMRRWRRGLSSRVTVVAITGAAVTALVTTLAAFSSSNPEPSSVAGSSVAVGAAAPESKVRPSVGANDRAIDANAKSLLERGRQIFRHETFGDEAWWTDTLRLHMAIAGDQHGGVGGGVSPATALTSVSRWTSTHTQERPASTSGSAKVDLDDPAVTLALLKLDAVVGVKATLSDDGNSIERVRHHLRPLPLDRRRFVRTRHRPSTRRLAEPRSECRPDRLAGPEPPAVR